jgi:hypothetical protein
MLNVYYGVTKSEFRVSSSVVKLKSIQSAITPMEQLVLRLEKLWHDYLSALRTESNSRRLQCFIFNGANEIGVISKATLTGIGN